MKFCFILGRSKGASAQRKALADIKNVDRTKSVSFEAVKPSLSSTGSKPFSQKSRSVKLNTPGPKGFKIHLDKPSTNTPRLKPGNLLKGSATPFKIYQDTLGQVVNTQTTRKNEHNGVFEKEYMPPCTDKGIVIHFVILKSCSKCSANLVLYLGSGRGRLI